MWVREVFHTQPPHCATHTLLSAHKTGFVSIFPAGFQPQALSSTLTRPTHQQDPTRFHYNWCPCFDIALSISSLTSHFCVSVFDSPVTLVTLTLLSFVVQVLRVLHRRQLELQQQALVPVLHICSGVLRHRQRLLGRADTSGGVPCIHRWVSRYALRTCKEVSCCLGCVTCVTEWPCQLVHALA